MTDEKPNKLKQAWGRVPGGVRNNVQDGYSAVFALAFLLSVSIYLSDSKRVPDEDLSRSESISQIIMALAVAGSAMGLALTARSSRLAKERENEIEIEENRLRVEEQYGDLNAEWNKWQMWLASNIKINQHDKPLEDKDDAAQQEIYYGVVTRIFEQAFIQFYKPDDRQYDRWWNTWHDTITEYLEKSNYRAALDRLLPGEDAQFAEYVRALVKDIEAEAPKAEIAAEPS